MQSQGSQWSYDIYKMDMLEGLQMPHRNAILWSTWYAKNGYVGGTYKLFNKCLIEM